jgi:hypothetical protein
MSSSFTKVKDYSKEEFFKKTINSAFGLNSQVIGNIRAVFTRLKKPSELQKIEFAKLEFAKQILDKHKEAAEKMQLSVFKNNNTREEECAKAIKAYDEFFNGYIPIDRNCSMEVLYEKFQASKKLEALLLKADSNVTLDVVVQGNAAWHFALEQHLSFMEDKETLEIYRAKLTKLDSIKDKVREIQTLSGNILSRFYW